MMMLIGSIGRMTEKRFTTNGYYVFDHQTDNQWLANKVEIDEIVNQMNNLDIKAKERSKALSTLQKKYDALYEDLEKEKQKNRAFKTILGCTKMRLKKIIGELE